MHGLAEKGIQTIKVNPTYKAGWLFAPYAFDVKVGEAHISIGRFSIGALNRIRWFAGQNPVVFRCGSFCDIANNVVIVVGGEHRNDSLLNTTFIGGTLFRHFMDAENDALSSSHPPKSVTLGDNVTISQGAVVLDGVTLGSGCVIGAASLVKRDCEPFGIYAGSPCRKLRTRLTAADIALFEASRWIDAHAHHLVRVPALLRDLQARTIDLQSFSSSISYLQHKAVVHAEAAKDDDGHIAIRKIAGFSLDGDAISDIAIVEKLKGYFAQAFDKTETVQWCADIFYQLGLV